MAEVDGNDVRVANSVLGSYVVASDDDGTGAAVQLVKLSTSDVDQAVAIPADAGGLHVQLGDSASVDAFGRLRVGNPETLFESSFEYDTQATWFEPVTSNSGTVTHDSDTRSVVLTATTDADSAAAVQTYHYWPYEKGKSQLIKCTFVLGAAVAGVTKRVGYFDSANGVYLQQAGDGTLSIVLRSSSSGTLVNTAVAQSSWNVDTLDGTGDSGITLDVTKAQILVIEAQWLGVGRVRVAFNIDGRTVVAHQFLNANTNSVAPYVQTFSLPIRYEIAASGATDGGTFQCICCEVESEGGVSSPNGYTFSAPNTADINTSTTRAHMLSIRPASTFNSLTNRSFVVPLDVTAIAASQSVLIEVFHGSTLTGGAWAAADTASAVEVGTGQTISAVGKRVASFFVAAAAQARGTVGGTVSSAYPITLNAAGTSPQALTVAATALTGTGTARAAITWKEIR